MKKRLSGCQMGCDLPCIREGCPHWGGWELTCDNCGWEDCETLYEYNGKELCEDCLREVKHISDKCEECGKEESELTEWKGKKMCFSCFCKWTIGKTIPLHHFWCDECNEWVSELYFDESGSPMCFDCLKKKKEVKE